MSSIFNCSGGTAVNGGHFPSGGGNIFLDDVDCVGGESSIENCVHAGWSKSNCGHSEDAGVICSDTQTDILESGDYISRVIFQDSVTILFLPF